MSASVLPPAAVRAPLAIRYDLMEVAENIVGLIDDLADNASNAARIQGRIDAELRWMAELFAELRGARS